MIVGRGLPPTQSLCGIGQRLETRLEAVRAERTERNGEHAVAASQREKQALDVHLTEYRTQMRSCVPPKCAARCAWTHVAQRFVAREASVIVERGGSLS